MWRDYRCTKGRWRRIESASLKLVSGCICSVATVATMFLNSFNSGYQFWFGLSQRLFIASRKILIYNIFTGDLDCIYCQVLLGLMLAQHVKDHEAQSPAYTVDQKLVESGEHCQVENHIISIDLQKVMLLPHMPSKFDSFIRLPYLYHSMGLEGINGQGKPCMFFYLGVKESFFLSRMVVFHLTVAPVCKLSEHIPVSSLLAGTNLCEGGRRQM